MLLSTSCFAGQLLLIQSLRFQESLLLAEPNPHELTGSQVVGYIAAIGGGHQLMDLERIDGEAAGTRKSWRPIAVKSVKLLPETSINAGYVACGSLRCTMIDSPLSSGSDSEMKKSR